MNFFKFDCKLNILLFNYFKCACKWPRIIVIIERSQTSSTMPRGPRCPATRVRQRRARRRALQARRANLQHKSWFDVTIQETQIQNIVVICIRQLLTMNLHICLPTAQSMHWCLCVAIVRRLWPPLAQSRATQCKACCSCRHRCVHSPKQLYAKPMLKDKIRKKYYFKVGFKLKF